MSFSSLNRLRSFKIVKPYQVVSHCLINFLKGCGPRFDTLVFHYLLAVYKHGLLIDYSVMYSGSIGYFLFRYANYASASFYSIFPLVRSNFEMSLIFFICCRRNRPNELFSYFQEIFRTLNLLLSLL